MATKSKQKTKSRTTSSKKTTKPRVAKSSLKSKKRFPLWSAIVLIAIIAGTGLYLVYNSFAANPGQLQPVSLPIWCYEGSCSLGDNAGVQSTAQVAFASNCSTGYKYKTYKGNWLCLDAPSVGLAKLVWHWQPVADCESTDNIYASNGSFKGWLQFDQQTWSSAGGSGSPYGQSREYTARIAKNLKASRGLQPWGACGQRYR